MKTIYDNQPMKELLSEKQLPDGEYIHINLIEGNSKRSQRKGLDLALKRLESPIESPVVLYSFENTATLFSDKRFMRIMAKPNFHFLRLPFKLEEVSEYLTLPTFKNEALEIAAYEEEKQDLLGILRHSYKHNPIKTIERARRELGLSGNDDEISNFIQNYQESELPQKNLGKISGVFCDIEGTLLREGKIDINLLMRLINYASQYPIVLWTGGDVKRIRNEFGRILEGICEQYIEETNNKINLHLRTPILSKYIFRGSQPEIVLDDLTLDEFIKEYRIKPQNYIKI